MATVYLAIQQGFEREVALKVLAASLSEDAGFSERFMHEAKVISRLVHPNIVTVYDVGIDQGRHYLSMEYVPGRELKNCMADLSGDEILKVMCEIASALDFAGQKGCVHRDVKPENIMLHQESGRAVLMDFGIAKSDDVVAGLTQTGMALGTPYYMSPEQARGQAVDSRADLYSLGIVLYKVLMGTVPYDGDSAVAIGIKHITEPIPQLPIRIAVFQPVLDKLMAKDPALRYQRGAELVADLKLLSGEVIDKSRKQYFHQAGKRKITPVLTGDKSAQLFSTDEYSSSVLAASQSQKPSLIKSLLLLMLVSLLSAYYHFFGLVLPPKQAQVDAAMQRLGLVQKPLLTLEDILQKTPEPEAVLQESATVVSNTEEGSDGLISAVEEEVSVALPLQGDLEGQTEAINVLPQLLERASDLELAYQQDTANLPVLVESYRAILIEDQEHPATVRRLQEIENNLLESVAIALDEKVGSKESVTQLNALLDHAIKLFPELSENNRYQRLLGKFNEQSSVYQLLAEATRLKTAGQLDQPADENALLKYRAALVIDADNLNAKKGIESIVESYYQRAKINYQKKAYRAALNQAARGLAIMADHPGLKQVKNELQAALKQQQNIASLMSQAESLERQGNIFTGAESAVQKLNNILKVDKQYEPALDKRQGLLNDLVATIESLIAEGNLERAEAQLLSGLQLIPGSKSLQDLRGVISDLSPTIELLQLSGEPITNMQQDLPDSFSAGRVLYIGFSYKNFINATTVLQATLFDGEGVVQIAAVPVVVSGRQGDAFFKIQRPVEGYKAGGYHITVVLADQEISSRSFVIVP